MAETFSNQQSSSSFIEAAPEGGAQQGAPLRVVSGTAGNVGSAGLSMSAQGRQLDPSVMGLLNIASNMLAPKIAQAKQAQYMQGVQEAQSGKALTEIMSEMPEYANVFAPSAAAEGARAYTVQTQMATFAAEMEQSMQAKAALSPEQFRQEVFAKHQTFLTGDGPADAMITQAGVEMYGPLFKQHTKNHYVYTQNKASEAQLNSMAKSGELYAAIMNDPTSSPEDREAAGSRLIGQTMPFGDQSPESHENNMVEAVTQSLERGDFHFMNLLKSQQFPDEAGNNVSLWERLPSAKRADIEGKLPAYANRALAKQMWKYHREYAEISRNMYQSPEKKAETMLAFNQKVLRETGIPGDMFSGKDIANYSESHYAQAAAEIDRMERGQYAADNKAAEKELAIARAQAALMTQGGVVIGKTIGQFDEKEAEQALMASWQGADANTRATILNNQTETLFNTAREWLHQTGIGSNPDKNHEGVRTVAEIYKNLDPAAQAKYFNEEQGSFYARYNAAAASMPSDSAFDQAKHMAPLLKSTGAMSSELAKAVQEEVRDRNSSWFFRSEDLRPGSQQVLSRLVSQFADANPRFSDSPERMAKAAIGSLLATREADQIGRHLIFQPSPEYRSDFRKVMGDGAMNISPEKLAERLDAKVLQVLEEIGGSEEDYQLMRQGESVIVVYSTNEESEFVQRTFDINELREEIKRSKPAQHRRYSSGITRGVPMN